MRKNQTFIFFVLVVFVFGFTNQSFSQKAIELTNKQSNKKRIILTNQRVVYFLKEEVTKANVGIITSITNEGFTVGDKSVAFEDLKPIGRRRKGSGFITFMASAIGVSFLVNAIVKDEDPCPDCIDEGTTGEGYTVVEAGLGVVFVGLAVLNASHNSALKLDTKWNLVVIDQPPMK